MIVIVIVMIVYLSITNTFINLWSESGKRLPKKPAQKHDLSIYLSIK